MAEEPHQALDILRSRRQEELLPNELQSPQTQATQPDLILEFCEQCFRNSLHNDGSWMIVEPFANDDLQDNLNPIGRMFYSFSTLLCTPCSRSQEVGLCLGAQAGEGRIKDVVTSAGFTRFRRATQTPFNLVYEARP